MDRGRRVAGPAPTDTADAGAVAAEPGLRDSPIAGVVLIGGDVDALAGLLVLRERQPFTVYAPRPLLDLLEENRIFDVLDPAMVRREAFVPLEPMPAAAGLC